MSYLIFGIFVLIFILAIIDISVKNRYIHLLCLGLFLVFAPHFVAWIYLLLNNKKNGASSLAASVLMIAFLLFTVTLLWFKVNITPVKLKENITFRLRVMMGGRSICYYATFALFAQCVFYLFGFQAIFSQFPAYIWLSDLLVTLGTVWFLLTNGVLRIFFASKRLRAVWRALLLMTAWIPVVNLIAILYCCMIIEMEYDHECYKIELDKIRVENQMCATKYPLFMLHGVGFHDLKYFNYWGRIPKALIKHGASIYYGNQESWGTIKDNAADLKKRIFEVMKETGCEKVNIIAHSKGGLDARYLISGLEMGDYVASLTTISTPHHGSKVIDWTLGFPDGIFRFLAKRFDKHCLNYGDKHPDFYSAAHQFGTKFAEEFNKTVPDVPQVYYQSYTSVMGGMFSDSLLGIPYLIVRSKECHNDGLVCVESAMWGNFRGVFSNRHRRGISHGDMIDLKREDYKGFDVIETYVGIVSELKQMGY